MCLNFYSESLEQFTCVRWTKTFSQVTNAKVCRCKLQIHRSCRSSFYLFICFIFLLPPFPSTNRISEETKQEKTKQKKTLSINERTSPGRWVLSSPWTLFISIKCYLFVWLQMFPREAQMPLMECTDCYLRLKCIWWINWKLTKL